MKTEPISQERYAELLLANLKLALIGKAADLLFLSARLNGVAIEDVLPIVEGMAKRKERDMSVIEIDKLLQQYQIKFDL